MSELKEEEIRKTTTSHLEVLLLNITQYFELTANAHNTLFNVQIHKTELFSQWPENQLKRDVCTVEEIKNAFISLWI